MSNHPDEQSMQAELARLQSRERDLLDQLANIQEEEAYVWQELDYVRADIEELGTILSETSEGYDA